MKKILFFLSIFGFFFITKAFSSSKEKIINNLININNLSFDFKQIINKKRETGNCIIKYPKLIYCLYDGYKRKEMVSNGKSLVIKNNHSNNSYIYRLKSTPLYFILDKDYLLNQLYKLEPDKIKNNNIVFQINSESNKIYILFDKNSYNLAGWKTIDIYQNEVFFEIKNIKKNQSLSDHQFTLPSLN